MEEDLVKKRYFSDNERFADLINGYGFDGSQVVTADDLEELLGVYSSDPEVIAYGLTRFKWIGIPYFLCGIMDALVGMLRGLGYAIVPMFVSIIGACGFRILWIATVFAQHHSLDVLFSSYSISWILTGGTHLICYLVVWKRLRKRLEKSIS